MEYYVYVHRCVDLLSRILYYNYTHHDSVLFTLLITYYTELSKSVAIKNLNLNVSSSFFIFQCCWKILLHKKRPYILQKQNIIPFFAPSLLCTKIYSLTFEICRQKKLVGSFLTNELTCLS